MHSSLNPIAFVRSHPFHRYSSNEEIDYSVKDNSFIQCIRAMEALRDMDAYIVDYRNEKILYVTEGSLFYTHSGISKHEFREKGVGVYDDIVFPEDLQQHAAANYKMVDLFYSLPVERRLNGYYTYDFRIRNKWNRTILVNFKLTPLDLTSEGVVRLILCVMSYPTHDKPGNTYFKLNDTGEVYEFIPSVGEFLEVKTQQITSKASKILQLAGRGKTEKEMSELLGISVNTVKYHKKKIFTQLGVHTMAQAVQWVNNQKKGKDF